MGFEDLQPRLVVAIQDQFCDHRPVACWADVDSYCSALPGARELCIRVLNHRGRVIADKKENETEFRTHPFAGEKRKS